LKDSKLNVFRSPVHRESLNNHCNVNDYELGGTWINWAGLVSIH